MLNKAGEPIPEIFLNDSLHMNAKGYAIWQKRNTTLFTQRLITIQMKRILLINVLLVQ
jgi:hypothetical protein